jgi:lysozyme family protein
MADFEQFIPTLLAEEGGWNPTLDGGTNMGIDLETFREYGASLGYNITGDDATDNATLQTLTQADAESIYLADYWDPIQGDNITDQNVADILFDSYVNTGGNGVKIMQQTLNMMGSNLSIDGSVGPATLAAINSTDPGSLYNNFLAGRTAYYNYLGGALSAVPAAWQQFFQSIDLQSNPTVYGGYLSGWLDRLENFPAQVLTAIEQNPGTAAAIGGGTVATIIVGIFFFGI